MPHLAADLIKLNNLQLAGKLVSEELWLGIHGSRRSGVGVEFEQYRHYQPGDDPKRIDWKLYARTGKHQVRESATESSLHIRFLLDLSGSMNYAEQAISRLDYARILLASLAYLGYRQGDAMSLYALQEGTLQTIAVAGKQAFQKILFGLEKAEARGEWRNGAGTFPEFYTRQKEMLVFVSDLWQVGDEWIDFIKSIANPRREVVIFQILGDQEMEFDLKGFYRFQDLETGREVELEADAVRETFRQNATKYLDDLEEALRLPHVHLIRARLSDPIAVVLRDFLVKR
ncbi:DUF58 domain-containing protein [Persicitalea jodogahamensis]|uniref:DUF58 domain-containing protein n=1 Tax=Persicitalea jodogahamensis TaxID=402147 RepID=A0A8J3G886_9BACT|nr:DUF58 domain-containing protein [Persicitalea jodogahamensis]GHB54140.1 hypothetical protein GCM10007390_03860 [Persicitalea jodogahamensis]